MCQTSWYSFLTLGFGSAPTAIISKKQSAKFDQNFRFLETQENTYYPYWHEGHNNIGTKNSKPTVMPFLETVHLVYLME